MKVSIIEEEKYSISRIGIDLKKKWFWVEYFFSFNDFKNNYLQDSDMYIIDFSSNISNWFKLVKWLKNKKSKSPIIIVFSKWNIEDVLYWFNLWVDDCMVKPYSKCELLARIKAILRRSFKIDEVNIIIDQDIVFDTINKTFVKNNNLVKLTSREIQLAEYLLFNIWKLITKIQLINSVWWEYDILRVTDNNINVTISNVRKKLWKWFKLKTVINRWYILEK